MTAVSSLVQPLREGLWHATGGTRRWAAMHEPGDCYPRDNVESLVARGYVVDSMLDQTVGCTAFTADSGVDVVGGCGTIFGFPLCFSFFCFIASVVSFRILSSPSLLFFCVHVVHRFKNDLGPAQAGGGEEQAL